MHLRFANHRVARLRHRPPPPPQPQEPSKRGTICRPFFSVRHRDRALEQIREHLPPQPRVGTAAPDAPSRRRHIQRTDDVQNLRHRKRDALDHGPRQVAAGVTRSKPDEPAMPAGRDAGTAHP